ncbi:MAG: hypothetical protein KJO12_03170, partial [Ignavibacteria bacterium]|nr:hypothetical protein [Ignavibacteria bacterium]
FTIVKNSTSEIITSRLSLKLQNNYSNFRCLEKNQVKAFLTITALSNFYPIVESAKNNFN